MPPQGYVLGASLRSLAIELAQTYLRGDLVLVAGAGVSRASGLPGWVDMVDQIAEYAATLPKVLVSKDELDNVLTSLHGSDPIGRADSLRRLLQAKPFAEQLHISLYGGLPAGTRYFPSVSHWHIASLAGRPEMPEVFTSNYDDLLEEAKQSLNRSGRIRHFHGRLPQDWNRRGPLGDPPVVTTRDYLAADEQGRYAKFGVALENRTALLVGFSLADPNLVRVIRDQAQDCRALVVATPGDLSTSEHSLRLNLMKRFWRGLRVQVTAIEAREELPAFLLALRRQVASQQGRTMADKGESALREGAVVDPWDWSGAREWRDALADAVFAAKDVVPGLKRDGSLRAGFYAIQSDGSIVHLVASTSTRDQFKNRPRRSLVAEADRPWGAAGYAFSAGVPIFAATGGAGMDRNVPEAQLLDWQRERATQGRLPASSVMCHPVWVRYDSELVPVGVVYLSSRRGRLAELPEDEDELQSVVRLTFRGMIKAGNVVSGGPV